MIYDLIVIGAGSGGVRAARIASVHGAKVAIVEDNKFGGTCVNVGCVPKKLYYYISQFNKDIKNYESYGWKIQNSSLNWSSFVKKKDKEITRLNSIYENILSNNKIKIINGTAKFKDVNTIKVGNKTYKSKKFIIATGSTPRKSAIITGNEYLNDSDKIFELKQLPKKMVIEGGGYIAIEFANIFSNLGVQIDLVYRGKKILKNFDDEIVNFLLEKIKKQKINIHLENKILSIKN
jgi:glutathione reductase (NADPH)